MKLSEALEFSTWSASEIECAKQPTQIRKVIILCRLLAIICTIIFALVFFVVGIYLKGIWSIQEESTLFKGVGLLIFLVLCVPLYFAIKHATIVTSGKLRIMPRKLARVTIENQRLSYGEIAVLIGVIAGT